MQPRRDAPDRVRDAVASGGDAATPPGGAEASLTKRDVLQAIAEAAPDAGFDPLASGHVQDVLLERHGERVHVAVVVDERWGDGPPPPRAVGAIRERVARLPGVASVRVVARPRPARPRGEPRPGSPAANGASGGLPPGLRRAACLAVVSGKGGVGKSSVAVNLAVALAERGLRVALLDCDLYGFSVPGLLGLERPPAVDGQRRILPGRGRGVEVMSMDFFVRDNQAVVWRGPMLGKALRQLLHDVHWSEADVLVLDMPPGTGDVALDVHALFPGAQALVVTTPDPFAARVAERAGDMARRTGHRVLGVVENLAYLACPGCGRHHHPFGRGGGDAVAAALGTRVLARIPIADPPSDPARGGVFPPDSPAGRAFRALAAELVTLLRAGEGPGSGQESDAQEGTSMEDRTLDVRTMPPARRHETIFARFEALGAGEWFELVNDHDPKPLYYQFQAEHPGAFTWEYVERGPEVWRVRIGRP